MDYFTLTHQFTTILSIHLKETISAVKELIPLFSKPSLKMENMTKTFGIKVWPPPKKTET
jgi:hypothetical protein